jgi:hypothetical protein
MMRTATATNVVTNSAKVASFAARRRRESRREEYIEQTKLAELLAKHLDPRTTLWSGAGEQTAFRHKRHVTEETGRPKGLRIFSLYFVRNQFSSS